MGYRPPQPDATRAFTIRVAQPDDLDEILRLKGSPSIVPEAREALARYLSSHWRVYFVAQLHDGQIIAWAKACFVRMSAPTPDAQAQHAPEGWYLMGIDVAPSWRQRGVASALTRARLRWLKARHAEVVFSCTRADNLPIHQTLRRCGFVELTRDFIPPAGVALSASEGILWAHYL